MFEASNYRTDVQPGTAATYQPSWRLLVAYLGDHCLGEITFVDLAAVVEEAAAQATRRRPDSTAAPPVRPA